MAGLTASKLTELLIAALLKAGRLQARPLNVANWQMQLGQLLKKDPEYGERVILYAIDQVANKFGVRVYSPRTLKAKYGSLKQKMLLATPEQLEKGTKQVMQQLLILNWPVEEEALTASVNRSLIAMRILRTKLRATTCTGAGNRLLDCITPAPDFCLLLYRAIWRGLQGWQDFSGSLVPFEFNPENSRTQALLRGYLLQAYPRRIIDSLFTKLMADYLED